MKTGGGKGVRSALVVAMVALVLADCGRAGSNPPPDAEEGQATETAQKTSAREVPDYATGPIVGLRPLAVLPVETGPKSVELAPGGERILVNDPYAHKVFSFDARTLEKVAVIPLPDEPLEADFSPDGRHVWVSLYNSSRVVIIDTLPGVVEGSVPTSSIPKEVAVSPDGRWVYAANWNSNTVTVIDAPLRQRVKDMAMYGVPRGICFSPDGGRAYVCIMGGNTLSEVDVAAGHVVSRQIPCDQNPRHVVLSPDGKTLYVSNNAPGTAIILDWLSGNATATIKVGRMARTIDATSDGCYLLACNYEDATVGCVDLAAGRQVFTCPTTQPIGLAVDTRGNASSSPITLRPR